MAKSKQDLLEEAQTAGLVAPDVTADGYTAAELQAIVDGTRPAWEGSASATEPIVAPDGHVVLSQEDIDNRA